MVLVGDGVLRVGQGQAEWQTWESLASEVEGKDMVGSSVGSRDL